MSGLQSPPERLQNYRHQSTQTIAHLTNVPRILRPGLPSTELHSGTDVHQHLSHYCGADEENFRRSQQKLSSIKDEQSSPSLPQDSINTTNPIHSSPVHPHFSKVPLILRPGLPSSEVYSSTALHSHPVHYGGTDGENLLRQQQSPTSTEDEQTTAPLLSQTGEKHPSASRPTSEERYIFKRQQSSAYPRFDTGLRRLRHSAGRQISHLNAANMANVETLTTARKRIPSIVITPPSLLDGRSMDQGDEWKLEIIRRYSGEFSDAVLVAWDEGGGL